MLRTSGRSSSLPEAEGAPSTNGAAREARSALIVDLLEARRCLAALETERAEANQTLNALLLRSLELESELDAAASSRDRIERLFIAFVNDEIARAVLENAQLEAAIQATYASPWWALKRALRSLARRRSNESGR